MSERLENFVRHYIATAIWSSTTGADVGTPLDQDYSADDLSPATLAKMKADCEKFLELAGDLIGAINCNRFFNPDCDNQVITGAMDTEALELAAHDFWLTRNGHGAGFWDGDWTEEAGEKLTAIAKQFGECDIYVGDDDQLHI